MKSVRTFKANLKFKIYLLQIKKNKVTIQVHACSPLHTAEYCYFVFCTPEILAKSAVLTMQR